MKKNPLVYVTLRDAIKVQRKKFEHMNHRIFIARQTSSRGVR